MSGKVIIRENRFGLLAARAPEAVGRIIGVEAHNILAGALNDMSGPKSGRIYGKHRASAPGEAPARETGLLANSGKVERKQRTVYRISFSAEYGLHLEYGTGRMAARPFLRPNVEKRWKPLVQALAQLERHL